MDFKEMLVLSYMTVISHNMPLMSEPFFVDVLANELPSIQTNVTFLRVLLPLLAFISPVIAARSTRL